MAVFPKPRTRYGKLECVSLSPYPPTSGNGTISTCHLTRDGVEHFMERKNIRPMLSLMLSQCISRDVLDENSKKSRIVLPK
jgi:hypothetical protein